MTQAGETKPDIRVCFLGDSFTLGTGDDTGLGWVGRVLAAERGRGIDLTVYNLGVRGDTGLDIAERAFAEVAARIGDGDFRRGVVLSFGANDIYQSIAEARSLQALNGLLRWAEDVRCQAFAVGPPPAPDQPMDRQRAALQSAQESVCRDLAVPFLDLRAAVADWSHWHQSAARGDGVHPGAEGYRPVAEAFGAWSAWREWLAS